STPTSTTRKRRDEVHPRGSPLRDSAAIAALAERSGWTVERTIALGWGTEATVLRRA
ncbi:hypothetical protein I3W98_21760, partial [Streptomyces cavourensis]|nr:hypothetical protein [Streptomyces cavourensis]